MVSVFLIIHRALNASHKLANRGSHPGSNHVLFAQWVVKKENCEPIS